jgi:hypothetical protein
LIWKDRLLLNYDVTHNNNDSNTLGSGPGFSTNDASQSTGLRQDAVVTYQKKFKAAKSWNLNSITTTILMIFN